MRTDDKFQCIYDDAVTTCTRFGIEISATGIRRRKKSGPTTMQDFVMDRFVTASSDALPSSSREEQIKNELRVDFCFPVLDAVAASLNSRFNSDCTKVMKLISSFVQFGDDFEVSE